MKKLIVYLVWFASHASAVGQDQFTNWGDFRAFTGAQVGFFGNFVNHGSFTDESLSVSFSGSTGQSISGTSAITMKNLIVNASSQVTTLQSDVVVSNTLTLTAGVLDLNSRTLTISNSASAAIARTNGYIVSEQTDNSGKVKWNIGTNTEAHVFPFGLNGAYLPFTFQVTTGDVGNVTVSTYATAADNTPYPSTPNPVMNVDKLGSDNSANMADRFWQIDKDGPSGTVTLTFEASIGEIGSLTDLKAQRWNTSTNSWDAPLEAQSSTATSVTVSGITSFSPWAVSGTSMSLPIELISFTATIAGTGVDLDWKTSSEINNDYFIVQCSRDGKIFKDIAKIQGTGTSSNINTYHYFDAKPFPGRSYYRLKQVDFDGTLKFSDVKSVEFAGTSENNFMVYPNPVTNKFTFKSWSSTAIKPIAVINAQGMTIGTIDLKMENGLYTGEYSLTNNPPGLYILQISNAHRTEYRKIIKR